MLSGCPDSSYPSSDRLPAHRDAVAMTVLQSCRLSGLVPADYLAAVTPRLLLHRRGRKQDLAAITPASMAAVRQASKPG
jgi:hypothetical protein